ncbi:MAG: hypothetical protein ABI039_09105, partial [Vicinamibacterales bacterium]
MAQLNALLSQVRRRWFARVAMRTIGVAAGAAAVPILAAIVFDRLLAPAGAPLMLLGAAASALALGAAALVGVRIERRPDDGRVARFI